MAGLKIRKGDTVEIIAGKDRGSRGTVLEADPGASRVVVEGRNLAKKHSRPRPVPGTRGAQMTPGGVIEIELPIDASNVMLVCPHCHKATRVGFETIKSGQKVRKCKKCSSQIEVA
jgi:large subunit ribosomal protein L24